MKLHVLLCVGLASLAFAAPAAAQTSPPAEAFGRLPAVADAAISPDGRRVALATNQSDGQSAVLIVNLDQPSERRVGYTVGGGEQLRALGWADNDRLAYLVSETFHPSEMVRRGVRFSGSPRRIDYFRWASINTTTGNVEFLTLTEPGGLRDPNTEWADFGAQLISPIEGDPGYGRMIGRSMNLERGNAVLYRVHLDSGRARQMPLFGVNEHTVSYILARDGTVAGRLDTDRQTNRWGLFTYDGETPRLLLDGVSRFGEPMSIAGLLPDGRFVAIEPNGAGFLSLQAIDRGTGEMQVVHEVENADIAGVLTDPWTREVVGVAWTNIETEERYFDSDLQAVSDLVAGALPDSTFNIATWSQDRSRFIVYAERGLDGGVYYLFDRSASRLSRLAARYPDLEATLGERQSITYRARDGTRIPAYLTLPGGAARENLPLVLLVHGGPHARDTMDFDWWSTFLAARGYAVLQPNFRGSSGYGDAWEEAGRLQWGGLMQTDTEDGVAALIRSGMVDANRVCIVGASYGGYAALAGATLTPDRYRCAVSVAGVSDLEMMLTRLHRETGGRDDSMVIEWWRASIGDRQEDRERIRGVSPANLAARVQAPILLIHGTDDTVVPIEQSQRMQRALEAAGKDVRFVELRGDDHWLSDAPTRIQMLREIEGFLAEHLRD